MSRKDLFLYFHDLHLCLSTDILRENETLVLQSDSIVMSPWILYEIYLSSLNDKVQEKKLFVPFEAEWLWKNQEIHLFPVHEERASHSVLRCKHEHQLLEKGDLHTHSVQYLFLRSNLKEEIKSLLTETITVIDQFPDNVHRQNDFFSFTWAIWVDGRTMWKCYVKPLKYNPFPFIT